MAGGLSGGGTINSFWAIASGFWAGLGVAGHARRNPPGSRGFRSQSTPLGQADPRPRTNAEVEVAAVVAAVREEMAPLEKNFLRSEATLSASLSRHEEMWRRVCQGLAAEGATRLRSREAAGAMSAARFSLIAARARTESRENASPVGSSPAVRGARAPVPADRAGRDPPRARDHAASRGRVMIEVISDDRCVRCDICVRVCPANVFAKDEQRFPVIARQDDCQTCDLCEIYCPTDALFVAPAADGPVGVTADWVDSRALRGSYARGLGWSRGRAGGAGQDTMHHPRVAQV